MNTAQKASRRRKKAFASYIKRKKRVLSITERSQKHGGRITTVILLLLVLAVLSPWIIWLIGSPSDIVTVMYDKTVTDNSYRQHAALTWFLKHVKAPTLEGTRFHIDRDYFGLHLPDVVLPLPILDSRVDLLYVADTYGKYTEAQVLPGTSRVIYGGLDDQDLTVIRDFLGQNHPNTLVAEYNTFGTPTRDYIQTQAYELLRVRWTGWIGQYVVDLGLDSEVPAWFKERYRTTHGNEWNFAGPGFIFADDEQHVLVLTCGPDIAEQGSTFTYTREGTAALGLSGTFPYNKIFDIVEPLDGSSTLAEYSLHATEQGAKKLREAGLPLTFPAIVSSDTAYHTSYYFAGNFADAPVMPNFHYLAFIDDLMRIGIDNSITSETGFFWHVYVPLMRAVYREASERKRMDISPPNFEIDEISGTRMVSRTNSRDLQIYLNGQWQTLFVHGVNIGIAMPGKWFTEFPNDLALYYRWLESIGSMQANTIRVYTLLDPRFYQALALYNQLHPDYPLWLMQEIWPEEHPVGNDYLDALYQQEYEREIHRVIDAIHGNATIAQRSGRAWGTYTADVSPYVLGYLVGRELEPIEVEQTDLLNAGYRYEGSYLSSGPSASPTEAWLAQSADAALAYEEAEYGWQHPVAIVSWPTLDVIDHESERNEKGEKVREFNDYVDIDINNIIYGKSMKAGLFGAYHIYPNYPDFMNNDPLYDEYHDEEGRFRYGGYLKEFMEHHLAYPAVVAEFGIATGLGNAHSSPDGYHHGSLSEQEQGEGIIRMFEAMRREGYAGGIIFEWMDEWAKKTWTTEPYMIPYDRHIIWHNVIDPEQNYGLLAMESVKPSKPQSIHDGTGFIKQIALSGDVSYLWIDIELAGTVSLEDRPLFIGLDTYERNRGELRYLPDASFESPSGMEFLIVLDGVETSRLLTIGPYNSTSYRYTSHPDLQKSGQFESMARLTNKERALADGTPIEAKYEDSSALRYGPVDRPGSHWYVQGNHISIRIPWGRINVTDPSEARVLDDGRIFYSDPERDKLNTAVSQGIGVSALMIDKKKQRLVDSLPLQGTTEPLYFEWSWWNQPVYSQRLKESYEMLQSYFIRKSDTYRTVRQE